MHEDELKFSLSRSAAMWVSKGSGGAGGNWPTIGEMPDMRAVAQQDQTLCGCACALTVCGLLEVSSSLSQPELSDVGGNIPFSVEILSSVMNAVWGAADLTDCWVGSAVGPPDDCDYSDVVSILLHGGPWIAHLRDSMARLGHFVVVIGDGDGHVELLDPFPPGTVYQMTIEEFLRAWTYHAVYRHKADDS